MKSDAEYFIEACIKRDEKACRQLYERFAPKMYGVCLRYTHSSAAAEDVLHDGFIKVFENLDKLRDANALGAWIKRIMVHTAINYIRSEKPLVLNDFDKEYGNYATSDDIYDKIDADIVMKAIQELPGSFRSVLNLCEVEGYSIKEASEMLKIKESSVRGALVRAKRMLAEKLKEQI